MSTELSLQASFSKRTLNEHLSTTVLEPKYETFTIPALLSVPIVSKHLNRDPEVVVKLFGESSAFLEPLVLGVQLLLHTVHL